VGVNPTSAAEYSARHLSVLEGLAAVRKRPGMYIGSTDSRGLMHCLWEIVDNSVDEALAGAASRIDVILHPDGSVEVRDDGRGIPVDEVPGVGLSGVEVVYTKLHAGGKFDSGNYASAGGLHGVGASVVNALSARLDVEVDRGSKTHRMTFRRGEPGTFAEGPEGPSADAAFRPFEKSSALEVVGKVRRGVTGTRVRYWADQQIFPSSSEFSLENLVDRARQTSFLVPGLTIAVADRRAADESEHTVEEFRHDGGTRDFVDFLSRDHAVTEVWSLTGSGTYSENVQQLDSKGHLRPVELERTCEVDIALRWGSGFETTDRSFVNIIATPKGGTHVNGFEQAVLKVLRKQIEANARRLKVTAKDPRIEKDDALAGLTAVVAVRLPEPQFEGQTKEVLGTAPVRQVVAKVVERELTANLTSTKGPMKAQATALMEKVVGEMRARVAARTQKDISRRKNALENSALPTKLVDCRTKEVASSELFLVEGDSALGTARRARNSEFQALLPLRGKILNVQKASAGEILNNTEVATIFQVIGAGSGRTFDLDAARYGKIVIMTDADVDGAHIRNLLLTLLFSHCRPLVEAGRVFAAVPPLHRVETSASGRRPGEIHYTYSDAELGRLLAKLEKQGKKLKGTPQRYKGLGEMDADQLAETTMDPTRRTLRRITVADEDSLLRAEEVFELLMGSDVAPRKDFIVSSASEVDREKIDA
jgi:DNA gyrase subunit B